MLLTAYNVALGAIGVSVVYTLVITIYRLTLHPLAKYPGPFWAKVTSLYDTYHSYIKDRHLDQFRCHEKYGPIVRYSPDLVIFNTSTSLKEIYGGSKNVNLQKGPFYKFLHDANTGATSTHSEIDKEVHATKRKIMSHAFSEAALRDLEPFMIENIDKWLVALGADANESEKGWTPARNMAEWANHLTFDVLGDLCFGKSFGMVENETLRDIPKFLLSRSYLLQAVGNGPFLNFWKSVVEPLKLDWLLFPSMTRRFIVFRDFATAAMKERMALAAAEKNKPDEEAARKDFVYWLLRGQDPVSGHVYSKAEFAVESRLLIVAGSDTSSITMAAMFYYLSRNPEALKKLQEELRSAFSSTDEIVTGQELSDCHYLRAVIDETLRISPPVGSSLQREVLKNGVTIDGHHFAAGTLVGSSAYAIQHNKDYFPDAHVFRPERWLANEADGVTAEDVSAARAAFCPFSIGQRGCIGRQMAYNELSIACGRVFYEYDIRAKQGDRLGEGAYGEYHVDDVFVGQRDGPMIEFRRHA